MRIRVFTLSCALLMILASCSSTSKLTTTKVAYQSIRTKQINEKREDSKIAVGYAITPSGQLAVAIRNLTSEIMIIDQTKSFFVNTDGTSTSYYDPTVKTTSVTDISSSTDGHSVNLGAVAGALGVGGVVGTLMSGINVGGSETSGTSTTTTNYTADIPQISLGPKGSTVLNKYFQITNVGKKSLEYSNRIEPNIPFKEAIEKFSVCISYSIDGGESYNKLVTDFYKNSEIVIPVENKGKTNDSLRKIFTIKSDAIYEPCWLLHFVNNIPTSNNTIVEGGLSDYQ